MKLLVEIEIQQYGSSEDEEALALAQIASTIIKVVDLCDLSVGTFTKTEIKP